MKRVNFSYFIVKPKPNIVPFNSKILLFRKIMTLIKCFHDIPGQNVGFYNFYRLPFGIGLAYTPVNRTIVCILPFLISKASLEKGLDKNVRGLQVQMRSTDV